MEKKYILIRHFVRVKTGCRMVKVIYEKTVFEAPFQAQRIGVELSGDESEIEKLQEQAVQYVNSFIEQYAPNVKTFEDLERMRLGLPPIGKHTDVIDLGDE